MDMVFHMVYSSHREYLGFVSVFVVFSVYWRVASGIAVGLMGCWGCMGFWVELNLNFFL